MDEKVGEACVEVEEPGAEVPAVDDSNDEKVEVARV